MDTKKIAELLMSGIKENLIICGYLFQNMEQEEIDEVFKEIFLELDSIYKHSDDIMDYYYRVDKGHLKIFWSSQHIYLTKDKGIEIFYESIYKVKFHTSPSKGEIVSFLTNL
jgi:hypothetical protein